MNQPPGTFKDLPMADIALRPLPYLQSCADNDYRTAVDAAKELKNMICSAESQQIEVEHLVPPLMNRARALVDILSLGENVRQSEVLFATAAGEAQASLLVGEIALTVLMSDEHSGTLDGTLNACVEMAQCALSTLLADWIRPTHALGCSPRKPLVTTNASAPTSTATMEELAAVLHSRLHQVLLMYLQLLWVHLPGGRKATLSSADGDKLEQPSFARLHGHTAAGAAGAAGEVAADDTGANRSQTDSLLINLALQVSVAPPTLEGTGVANSRVTSDLLPSSQLDAAAVLAMRILTSAARERDGSARIINSWNDFMAAGGFGSLLGSTVKTVGKESKETNYGRGNGSEKLMTDTHIKSRDPASLVMRLTSRYATTVTRCYRSHERAAASAEALVVATLEFVAALVAPESEGPVGRVHVSTAHLGSGKTAAHRNPKWITRHLEVLAIAYLMADSLVLPPSDTSLNPRVAARHSSRCRSALATVCASLSELDSEEGTEVQRSTIPSALQKKRPWDGELRILLLLLPTCRVALMDLGAKMFKPHAVDGSTADVQLGTSKYCIVIAWVRCLQGLSQPRDACVAIKSGTIQVSFYSLATPSCAH